MSTDISVASDDNPLTETDHAIRIVDAGDIPDSQDPGEYRPYTTIGHSSPGEPGVYVISNIISDTRVPAQSGEYAGTGKTIKGGATLGRTVAHEFLHSAGFGFHPTPGTMDGNLLHLTRSPNAGMEVLLPQLLIIKQKGMKKNPSQSY